MTRVDDGNRATFNSNMDGTTDTVDADSVWKRYKHACAHAPFDCNVSHCSLYLSKACLLYSFSLRLSHPKFKTVNIAHKRQWRLPLARDLLQHNDDDAHKAIHMGLGSRSQTVEQGLFAYQLLRFIHQQEDISLSTPKELSSVRCHL